MTVGLDGRRCRGVRVSSCVPRWASCFCAAAGSS